MLKTQQHSISVNVKNQTYTKFNSLNDIISRLDQKATKKNKQFK